MWWLKILLCVCLLTIGYQDFKDKAVSFFWFPLLASSLGVLHFTSVTKEIFVLNIGLNIGIVSLVLVCLWLYIKARKQFEFFKVFGSGDALMFYALAFSMASISFTVCFVFSLLFALVLSLVFRTDQIPLAGYMAIFFLIIYLAHWFGWITQLYSI